MRCIAHTEWWLHQPKDPTIIVHHAERTWGSIIAGMKRRAVAIIFTMALGVGATALVSSVGALGPYPGLGSCSVFPAPPASLSATAPSLPNESAWNQDISRAPADPSSAAYISYIDSHGGVHLHPDFGSPRSYGFPYVVIGADQARLPIHYTAYGAESDPGPFPIPPNAPVEGGQRSEGDRHVLAVDRSSCTLYELYHAFFKRRPHPHWDADSGVRWNLGSAARRPDSFTSADAAGLPIFPGLVGYEEATAGRIDHAIRVTFDSTQNAWIHPASHCAGDTANPDAPPMGLRLRLRANYPLRGFFAAARAIAAALKHYGLIVADNGSNWYFSGTSDRRWNDANLDQLKRIPGSAFEVVKSTAPIHVC
jgi:hypothetical protein